MNDETMNTKMVKCPECEGAKMVVESDGCNAYETECPLCKGVGKVSEPELETDEKEPEVVFESEWEHYTGSKMRTRVLKKEDGFYYETQGDDDEWEDLPDENPSSGFDLKLLDAYLALQSRVAELERERDEMRAVVFRDDYGEKHVCGTLRDIVVYDEGAPAGGTMQEGDFHINLHVISFGEIIDALTAQKGKQ